jgi:hypothetical protein
LEYNGEGIYAVKIANHDLHDQARKKVTQNSF